MAFYVTLQSEYSVRLKKSKRSKVDSHLGKSANVWTSWTIHKSGDSDWAGRV
jgi:hypothetical protein